MLEQKLVHSLVPLFVSTTTEKGVSTVAVVRPCRITMFHAPEDVSMEVIYFGLLLVRSDAVAVPAITSTPGAKR